MHRPERRTQSSCGLGRWVAIAEVIRRTRLITTNERLRQLPQLRKSSELPLPKR